MLRTIILLLLVFYALYHPASAYENVEDSDEYNPNVFDSLEYRDDDYDNSEYYIEQQEEYVEPDIFYDSEPTESVLPLYPLEDITQD